MATKSSYGKAIGGKLTFKGGKASDRKKIKRTYDENLKTSDTQSSINDDEDIEEIKVLQGTGRISSSSTTVHGHETSFMSELCPGDAIIIVHPTTLQEETKIIRMVLSNSSMGISSGFSTDLISTTQFKYIKAPKDASKEMEKEKDDKHSKLKKIEEDAFGTYASSCGEKFVYRVKKEGAFGGYKIVTEDTKSALSREQLLDKRTKKKSDRFCY